MAEYLKLDKLSGLLSDFYKVTGQRIGIFDGNMSIILNVPNGTARFAKESEAVKRYPPLPRMRQLRHARSLEKRQDNYMAGAMPACWRHAPDL